MSNAPEKAALLVEREAHPSRKYVLDGKVFRIGRSTSNDLEVPEGHISKQHAEVRVEVDGFVVVDVGSRAGVTVNGAAVQRHVLVDGDIIELGDTSPVRVKFEMGKGSAPDHADLTWAAIGRNAERDSMGRLARFFEFSHKLGGRFSLEEVLQDVVDLAIEVTKAERGMLILRRSDGSLDMRVARNREGHSLPLDGLKVSETLVRHAFELGKASVIGDVHQEADLALAESIVSLELRSAVTLPLLRFETKSKIETAVSTVFGLIYVDSRRLRSDFDGFDMRILERLAQDASSVIENARLLGEAEEKKRIDREVQMAREVQAALMPEQFESTATFAVAGTCVPCHDLGGDYVDQFLLDGGRQVLVVADVCGKGIAASLLAATLQGALAAEIARDRPLGEIVSRVNRVHCRLAPSGKFITMVVALLEPDGSVCIVNAGHGPVLHAHAGGVAQILTDGMALGLDDDADYRDHTLQMQPGDTLVITTDGVGECEGPDRELFGDERLEQLLASERTLAPAQLLSRIMTAVDEFRRGVAVSDDLTALIVRRR